MRKTPAQIAVQLICGVRSPDTLEGDDLVARIQEGHDWLVKLTGRDFGYDLQAWHDHLKETRDGDYTFARNIPLPKVMQQAIASSEWQIAVAQLNHQS